MSADVPPRVQARATELGFDPLVARIRHPNGGVYAAIYAGYLLFAVGLVLAGVAGLVTGNSRLDDPGFWLVSAPILVLSAAAAVWLYRGMVGSVTRRAFYLYPQGYLYVAPSGRVARESRWDGVAMIEGMEGVALQVQVAGRRTVFVIKHFSGRSIRFTERHGREVLGPMAYELRQAAAAASRDSGTVL
ncbi:MULTISPECIES: hypothetical protein [Actinoplanes]|uniref:hypothetical protein n=1 Tax=Actinoplanes TaxID=1865 RepID=UPI0005F2E21B|nr:MULTISPECIES: hypothetical protein [Actinoplanes]GLY02769.1 hypothetical protein Acsp01_31480 [Actinoplanes sp. NBRC 101535]